MSYEADFKILAEQKRLLESKAETLASAYAYEKCPFKPGELITIYGRVYKGRKGKVTSVIGSAIWRDARLIWVVRGFVLKRDGSVGTGTFEFTEDDWKYDYNSFKPNKE